MMLIHHFEAETQGFHFMPIGSKIDEKDPQMHSGPWSPSIINFCVDLDLLHYLRLNVVSCISSLIHFNFYLPQLIYLDISQLTHSLSYV